MKSNFLVRVTTAAVFVVILVGGTILHSATLFVIFTAIVLIGLVEFYRISVKAHHKPQIFSGIAFGIYIIASNFLIASGEAGQILYFFYIPFLIMIMIIELFRENKNPFTNVSITLFGAIYVGLPFGLLSYLVFCPVFGDNYNPAFLLAYFTMIWANDSGAYIIGSLIGKHKLFERISPKKTWEGFLGGIFFTLVAAFIISTILSQIVLIHWLAVGLITSVFGTFGDLIESQLKRSVAIKDSGKIMPGHGGILDRFDSIMLSAPIIFVYLMLFY